MGIKNLVLLGFALLVTQMAFARERFQLQFNDQESHGPTTLRLKQALREQYGVDARDLDLVGVRLIAKSLHGQGSAALTVGNWQSLEKRVHGSPEGWTFPSPMTFDELDFDNDAFGDRGVWQIQLRGNIKVRRVVLIVERDGQEDGFLETRNIRCESRDFRPATCPVRGEIVSLVLLDKHSNAPCAEGRSYGVNGVGIWVDDGCRATFQVRTQVH